MLLKVVQTFLQTMLNCNYLVVVVSQLLFCRRLENIDAIDLLYQVARLCLQIEVLLFMHRVGRYILRDSDDLLENLLAVELIQVFKLSFDLIVLLHHLLDLVDACHQVDRRTLLLSQQVLIAQVVHLEGFDLGWKACQVVYMLLEFQVFERLFEHFFVLLLHVLHLIAH